LEDSGNDRVASPSRTTWYSESHETARTGASRSSEPPCLHRIRVECDSGTVRGRPTVSVRGDKAVRIEARQCRRRRTLPPPVHGVKPGRTIFEGQSPSLELACINLWLDGIVNLGGLGDGSTSKRRTWERIQAGRQGDRLIVA
jgi:hypothetical protein